MDASSMRAVVGAAFLGVTAVAATPSHAQVTTGAPGNPGLSVSPSQIPESQRLRPAEPAVPGELQTAPSQLPQGQRLATLEQAPKQSLLLRQGTADERAVAVYERPLPDYDPVGIQFGSFYAFPALDLGYEFNNNIFAAPAETSDNILAVSPRLGIRSNFEQDQLNFDVRSANGFYTSHSSENFNDYDGTVNGRYYLTPTIVTFGRAGAAHSHESRVSPNAQSPTEPTPFNDYTAYAAIAQTGLPLDWQADVFWERLNFESVALADGTRLSNGFRNRDQVITTGRVGYEFSRQLVGFVRGAYNRRMYQQTQSGFDRDSDGYSGVVGMDLDLNSVFIAELFLGAMRQSYSDPTFGSITTPAAGLDAVWNITPNASLLAGVTRSIDETTLLPAAAIISTNASVGAQYQFLPNLQGRLDYAHSFLDFDNTTFHDDVDTVAASARYFIGRNVIVSPLLAYSTRSSNRAGADFDQVRGVVVLTLQY